jgi:preprotein translocase subunit SecY
MFQAFTNVARIPELRGKLLITAGLLVIYRMCIFIPVPGAHHETDPSALGDWLNFADIFAGGAIKAQSLLALGIMPYISAAIIFQLLAAVLPALQKIAKEGEVGRKRINQYSRYATVLLCLIQGPMLASSTVLKGPKDIDSFGNQHQILYYLMVVTALTVGTLFVMWLGEQIDEFGIGSGISLIIMAGILSRVPQAIGEISRNFEWQLGAGELGKIGPETVATLLCLFLFMVVGVVALTQAHRRVPIHTARTRTLQGFSHRSYIPLRLNMAGVISIIFAQSLMMIPGLIIKGGGFSIPLIGDLIGSLGYGGFLYTTLYALLIVFFTYFYTAVTFNPVEQANNFKEWGPSSPASGPDGIPPSTSTASCAG